MNRRLSLAAARGLRAAALSVLFAPLALAQTWESFTAVNPDFAHFERVNALGFFSADRDSLFIFHDGGYYLYAPGQNNGAHGDWDDISGHSNNSAPFSGLVTTQGTVLAFAGNRISRTADRGLTWDRDAASGHDGDVFFESSLPALAGADGTQAVFFVGNASLSRSTGDGARGTWENNISQTGGYTATLSEVQPSAALPNGRLLAGVFNGVTYSDDGGVTWQPSSVYGNAAFVAYSLSQIVDPSHPYGGPVFGGFDQLPEEELSIWRSDDGGETWAMVHEFDHAAWGLTNIDEIRIHAGRDGSLWAALEDLISGPAPDVGRILRSTDQGVTWQAADDGFRVTVHGLGFGTNAFMAGPDGHLYAATDSLVWRTADPLPVADESSPSEMGAVGVSVSPNPSRGVVRARVSLASPSESVTVEVYDAVGRRVAVLHEGAAVGALSLGVDTSGWAPGVYVVRAVGGGAVASASFTVVR